MKRPDGGNSFAFTPLAFVYTYCTAYPPKLKPQLKILFSRRNFPPDIQGITRVWQFNHRFIKERCWTNTSSCYFNHSHPLLPPHTQSPPTATTTHAAFTLITLHTVSHQPIPTSNSCCCCHVPIPLLQMCPFSIIHKLISGQMPVGKPRQISPIIDTASNYSGAEKEIFPV